MPGQEQKPQLILHIGAHKTGSTSIQSYFRTNQAALAEKGILYPRLQEKTVRHNSIVPIISKAQMNAGDNSEVLQLRRSLYSEISSRECHTVVLSNETFYCQSQAFTNLLIDTLRSLFSSILVVLYVRPQLDLWSSIYAQDAKFLQVLPRHTAWAHRGQATTSPLGNSCIRGLYFSTVLDMYRQKLGRGNVTARVYDRKRFPQGDVVLDFLSIIKTDLSSLPPIQARESNTSWGWKPIEISKYLAGSYFSYLKENPSERDYMVRKLDRIVSSPPLRNIDGWLGKRPNYMNEHEQRELFSHYEGDTLALKKLYIRDLDIASWTRLLPYAPKSIHEIPPIEISYMLKEFLKEMPPSLKKL